MRHYFVAPPSLRLTRKLCARQLWNLLAGKLTDYNYWYERIWLYPANKLNCCSAFCAIYRQNIRGDVFEFNLTARIWNSNFRVIGSQRCREFIRQWRKMHAHCRGLACSHGLSQIEHSRPAPSSSFSKPEITSCIPNEKLGCVLSPFAYRRRDFHICVHNGTRRAVSFQRKKS